MPSHFPLSAHNRKVPIPRHPTYPTYRGCPWYADDYTCSEVVRCECCNQRMVAYTYNLRLACVRALQNLTLLTKSGGEFIHTTQFVPVGLHVVSQLVHWGLAEQSSDYVPEKKTSGLYRPTEGGEQFIGGAVGVPARLVQYMGEIIAFCGKIVTIDECRARFDYRDIADADEVES
jgi:hypothetical protein